MLGSYHNPHAIQPGEPLTEQLLFSRYIAWSAYVNTTNAAAITDYCAAGLWSDQLCCDDHLRLQAERNVFVRWFCHFRMMAGSDNFSDQLIKGWIKELKLKYDIKVVAQALNMSEEACTAFLNK